MKTLDEIKTTVALSFLCKDCQQLPSPLHAVVIAKVLNAPIQIIPSIHKTILEMIEMN